MAFGKKISPKPERTVPGRLKMTCSNSGYVLMACCLMALLFTPEVNATIERPSPEDYRQQRSLLAEKEANLALGADIVLSYQESHVNLMLMELKRDELDSGFKNPYSFAPARHFFEVLDEINASPLYQFIREMPKGGVLHAHDMALASTEVIVNATYYPDLWQRGNFTSLEGPEFRFSRQKPTTGDGWQPVKDIREQMEVLQYDAEVRKFFSLYDPDPLKAYHSINDVWDRFGRMFQALEPIVTFLPVWENYFRQALQEFFNDNVMYLEFRGVLPTLYDLDGKEYGPEEVVDIYRRLTHEFTIYNPTFAGTKFIYAPLRSVDNQTVDQYLSLIERLHLQHGDYVVGFDLVGQEDQGRPLVDFAERLLNLPPSINFVFHAGETNWHGMPTDENLIDAILLGTKRIGHGYALLKHPVLLERARQQRICVEINPVSNQVLKLVDDYRNHPASVLFSTDFPLVVSSDDPSFWRADPLSHDFYMAFLGMASAHQDLRLLKKLALNSLQYSLMNDPEKAEAVKKFHSSWDSFIYKQYLQLTAGNRVETLP